jgi:SAM-dependent methyltransferase
MTTFRSNPLRGRLNSAFLAMMDGYIDRALREPRQRFAELGGVVVDLGAGNGPVLRYLRPGTVVHAVEPNPYFHRRLRRSAAAARVELSIHQVPGEAIDLPDASVDAVLCSWVLCSVGDPEAVLHEVRRILRPGGRFVFIEHVGAPAGPVRLAQRLVHRPWRWVFEGCHTDRDTAAAIQAAGFASVEVSEFRLRSAFVPIRTQIAGVAVVAHPQGVA